MSNAVSTEIKLENTEVVTLSSSLRVLQEVLNSLEDSGFVVVQQVDKGVMLLGIGLGKATGNQIELCSNCQVPKLVKHDCDCTDE